MPKAMISALWLSVAVTAIAGMLVNLSQMTIPLIAGVVFVALFPWFLRTSKRAKRAPPCRVLLKAILRPRWIFNCTSPLLCPATRKDDPVVGWVEEWAGEMSRKRITNRPRDTSWRYQ